MNDTPASSLQVTTNFGCTVAVGPEAFSWARRRLASSQGSRRVFFLIDENVRKLHANAFTDGSGAGSFSAFSDGHGAGSDPDALSCITLPAGEAAKSFAVAESVCRELVRCHVERGDIVVGVGGGAATDAAGFIASIVLRGIEFSSAPTTLLAMVDAAHGGKTGIDVPEGKNLVGTFAPASWVACDTSFLKTLPVREFRAGVAEIIKIAWIFDAPLFELLGQLAPLSPSSPELPGIIGRSIQLKLQVVARDPRETGERALLNFGHTLGHAMETEAGGDLLHGEAVSLGLVGALVLSRLMGFASLADQRRMEKALAGQGLPIRCSFDPDRIVSRVAFDKKRRSGAIRAVLTPGLGSASVADQVSESVVREAVLALGRDEALDQ